MIRTRPNTTKWYRRHQKYPSVTTSAFVCHTLSSFISSPEGTDKLDASPSVTATTILLGGVLSALWFKYNVMLSGSNGSALVNRTGQKSRDLNVDLTVRFQLYASVPIEISSPRKFAGKTLGLESKRDETIEESFFNTSSAKLSDHSLEGGIRLSTAEYVKQRHRAERR
jgi:hypothetical protein